MNANKIGFAAAILCVLLFSQAGSTSSMSISTLDGRSTVAIRSTDTTSFENAIPESSLSKMEGEIVVPQGLGTVAIIVENALYSSISAAVLQYRQDLNDTGYHTILYNSSISTAEQLKTLLSNWYDSVDLLGAVLIGRLPYAQYYHPAGNGFSAETFICDLFLTDLDGSWGDTNPSDGVYDSHSSTFNTDIFPEIFIGRIDPTCLTWGASVADHINTYLARVHSYRTGGVTRNRRALFYIDDDWEYWSSSWSSDAASAYSTRTLVSSPPTTTTATDWVNNRITQNYQWGHLAAHSSPTTHYFGPGGSGEGTATSSQIHSAPPSFNFYNLFCCSGAKWTISDNLGVTYTFSGSYSLASIGSSKTGSMLSNEEFYDPLGQNLTLGESLRDWFSDSLTSSSEAGSAYLEWFYGMNIIGDPLLTIYFDTTVR
ncbi:MAG: C25 family cysteine peptidase, partial [Candidatus Thorarchaeota archaeon]